MALFQGRVPCGLIGSPLQLGGPVAALSPDHGQQLPGIGRVVKGPRQVRPGPPVLRQPRRRRCVALELFVDLQHQLRQAAVVPARPQRIRQLGPAVVQPAVKVLQHLTQHPPAHQMGVALVQHPEVRRQCPAVLLPGQQVGILPQQRRTKGIHRLDIRLVDPQELTAQVSVSRRLGQALAKLGCDLAAKLRGGGLGIGDDQEVIHVAVLLRHIAEQPLHQHLGLARAGCGGHQQAAAPVLHHGLLLGRQGQCSHGSPSPSLRESQNSSGFTGRI